MFPPDISCLADHCGGSGAILLGTPKCSSRLDIYNDYDVDLTNFFLCVRDRPLALIQELSFFPLQSEAEFTFLKDLLNRRMPLPDFTADELRIAKESFTAEQYQEVREILLVQEKLWDVRRAAAFLKISCYSFSGTRNAFGIRKVSLRKCVRLIQEASARLEGVPITNRDCCDSIRINDAPGTLHYCDPPYYQAEDKYRVSFVKEDHIRLHDTLLACEGKVIVSYNDCPFIYQLYQDHYILRFQRRDPLSKKAGAIYKEVIITNFDPMPVFETNISQLSMFGLLSAPEDAWKLELIHTP